MVSHPISQDRTQVDEGIQTQKDDDIRNQLQDTQVIQSPSLNFQSSQPSKLKEIRMLNKSEENKIYDSSCEYKDTNIDTQELLQDLRKPDELILDSSEKYHVRSNEIEYVLKDTQGIPGPLHGKPQEDTVKSSTQFEDNLQISNSIESKIGTDVSWMKDVKDPFADSETPWLNKIKDPFKETPVALRTQDSPIMMTPLAIMKIPKSVFTPVPSAHKIFERLRGDQDRPELEVETQTQSAPNLIFNSLTQSPIKLRTQILDNEPYNNSRDNETQIDSPAIKIHRLKDSISNRLNTTDQESAAYENNEMHNIPEQENDTIKIFNTQPKSQAENCDTTQDDVQVFGTAPDNNSYPELNLQPIADANKGILEDDLEERLLPDDKHIAANSENISSPVVSDDESNSNTLSTILKNRIQGASYILAEDSIQKYHRDFLKTGDSHRSKSIEDLGSNETPKDLSTHSQPLGNSNILRLFSERKVPETDEFSNQPGFHLPVRSKTSLGLERISTDDDRTRIDTELVGKDLKQHVEEPVQNVFSEIGANITQDLSDIDDDSKINNTIEEEEVSRAKSKDDEDHDMPKFIKKSKRKNVNVITSPEPAKKSKKSSNLQTPNSVSPKRSSSLLDTDSSLTTLNSTSNESFLDQAFSTTQKQLPQEFLREEKRLLNETDVTFKEFVWCQYNAHFYPGLVESVNEKGFNVKFIDSVDQMSLVYPLDIRIGDNIIVDRFNYVVTGLECLTLDPTVEVIRCMRGYDTVVVKRMKKKNKRDLEQQEESFPIAIIKVANDEWFKRDRLGSDKFAKPRRTLLKDTNHTIPTYQDELLISTPQRFDNRFGPDIFSSCLFVITGDVDKDNITELIEKHGGSIMDDGFSSLIQFEDLKSGELVVKSNKSLQEFKFAALISNKHVRKPKYLETLALGWPLLSPSFIYDSIDESCLKEDFLTTYLLPAGESKRMKFTKTHNIYNFIKNLKLGQDLSKQLKNNTLLKNRYVILTSSNPEIIKFIFYILGAKKIITTSITNYSNLIQTLSKFPDISSQKSPVIIYHEKMKTLKSSLDSLDRIEKRSKKSSHVTSGYLPLNTGPIAVELVDWEWVVQCLIDGCPWPSLKKKIE